MREVVDINCDMGEAFGRWRVGDTDDARLMPLISSANIAAGFHAGDPNLMDETVRLAAEHGVGRLKVGDLARYGDPGKLAAMRAIKAALDPVGIMNPGAVLG